MDRFLTRGWEIMLPGVRWLSTIRSQSAIGQWDWGFHTVRDCSDPGDLRFRPQVVGVVQVMKNL